MPVTVARAVQPRQNGRQIAAGRDADHRAVRVHDEQGVAAVLQEFLPCRDHVGFGDDEGGLGPGEGVSGGVLFETRRIQGPHRGEVADRTEHPIPSTTPLPGITMVSMWRGADGPTRV
ncbi:hypothetical protein ACIRL2_49265 [Embleya sp. NPDC127516]|uniref:hypothetical protein n=1 Tax=Embleya sp. NPDC127516 TaxID=3363990 RepID=UPI003807C748